MALRQPPSHSADERGPGGETADARSSERLRAAAVGGWDVVERRHAERAGRSTRRGDRLVLRFPSTRAAEDVRELGGSRVTLKFGDTHGLGDAHELDATVLEVSDDTLLSAASIRSAGANGAWPPAAGSPLAVCWTELNDLASVPATFVGHDRDGYVVDCAWPPSREQRRAFRRLVVELPLWVVRTSARGEVFDGVTRDVSGGGAAVRVPGIRPEAGDRVVTVLRCEDRDVVMASLVHWSRPDQSLIGLSFERISQSDQDHLVGMVSRAEAARSR